MSQIHKFEPKPGRVGSFVRSSSLTHFSDALARTSGPPHVIFFNLFHFLFINFLSSSTRRKKRKKNKSVESVTVWSCRSVGLLYHTNERHGGNPKNGLVLPATDASTRRLIRFPDCSHSFSPTILLLLPSPPLSLFSNPPPLHQPHIHTHTKARAHRRSGEKNGREERAGFQCAAVPLRNCFHFGKKEKKVFLTVFFFFFLTNKNALPTHRQEERW